MATKKTTAAGPLRLTVRAPIATYVIDALLAGASTDEVTPILRAARVSVAAREVVGVSTDRYRVHRMTFPRLEVEGESAEFDFTIGADALQWVRRTIAMFTRARGGEAPIVTFDVDPERPPTTPPTPRRVEITVRRSFSDDLEVVRYSTSLPAGAYPPVARLFDVAYAAEATSGAEARLDLEYLSAMRSLRPERNAAPTLKFTVGEHPDKPGPVLIQFNPTNGILAEALLQPHLTPGLSTR